MLIRADRWPLLVAGVMAVAVVPTMLVDDGPVLCLFRRCTGGYCPGCGGTRAARALIGGDVAGAWQQHPYVVLLGFQAVGVALIAGLWTALGRPLALLQNRSRPMLKSWLVANAVLVVGIWVGRLLTGHIPVPFG